jgi:hydroxymethylglutaryl-CoA reductase
MNNEQFLKEEFPAILEKLAADDQPVWGKMSAQQMVEHLSGVILISNGRFEAPAMYEEEKLKRNYSFIIEAKNRLKRNTKAPILPAEPMPLRFASLAEAKEKLLQTVNSFFSYYNANPEAKQMHPAFGMLNFEEWTYFHTIHSQYHLEQFSLYEGGASV